MSYLLTFKTVPYKSVPRIFSFSTLLERTAYPASVVCCTLKHAFSRVLIIKSQQLMSCRLSSSLYTLTSLTPKPSHPQPPPSISTVLQLWPEKYTCLLPGIHGSEILSRGNRTWCRRLYLSGSLTLNASISCVWQNFLFLTPLSGNQSPSFCGFCWRILDQFFLLLSSFGRHQEYYCLHTILPSVTLAVFSKYTVHHAFFSPRHQLSINSKAVRTAKLAQSKALIHQNVLHVRPKLCCRYMCK